MAPTTTEAVDVRRLAHSVLMVGLPGPELDEGTAAVLAAGTRGVVLFAGNIDGARQLRSLTGAVACSADAPVLVAVDQELGPVARLRDLVTPLPTTAEALAMSPLELELTGQLLGEEMLDLGVNVDLAPVIDVVQGPNPVLADRHLGGDPQLVGELGAAFLRGLQQAGVVAVPKHFPGHGRSTTDPHGVVTRIDASLEELAAVDFPPFDAVIAAGAAAIMVGHPIYEALDPDLPASLSPTVLALLRGRFRFDGVAVTDSLSMAGVAAGREPGDLAVAALAAGEDLLLVVDPAAGGRDGGGHRRRGGHRGSAPGAPAGGFGTGAPPGRRGGAHHLPGLTHAQDDRPEASMQRDRRLTVGIWLVTTVLVAGVALLAYHLATRVPELAGRTDPTDLYADPTLLFTDPGLLGTAVEVRVTEAVRACMEEAGFSYRGPAPIEDLDGLLDPAADGYGIAAGPQVARPRLGTGGPGAGEGDAYEAALYGRGCRRRAPGPVRRRRPRRPRPGAGLPRLPSLLDRAARGRCPGPPRLCRRPAASGRRVWPPAAIRPPPPTSWWPHQAAAPGRRLRRRGALPGRPRAAGGRRRLRLPGRHPRPGDGRGRRRPGPGLRRRQPPATGDPHPPSGRRGRRRAWAPATSR